VQPAEYEAWYHTRRGNWIGATEFALLQSLLHPKPNESLLDVGCGTGYFTRRFAQQGLQVTGIDPDAAMLAYAQSQNSTITYLQGSAVTLPFPDRQFDHVSAITSLCFINDPQAALQEMWRVCRKSVVLGLLNRHSLLYWQKHHRGAYRGARWDTAAEVSLWCRQLIPQPVEMRMRSAIVVPSANTIARGLEAVWPTVVPFGSFLAVVFRKPMI
jgi:ubiquinone/menaquinone biosynthesis C-methylase UbiE